MSCPCEKEKRPCEKHCDRNTPPVIEINGGECPILFHTVNIPASVGDIETLPPMNGDYRNTRVYYEANRMSYLYDSDGIPQILSGTGLPEVTSVNNMAGDVVITLEDLGGATASALEAETTARTESDEAFASAIDLLNTKVADNTSDIALKADLADVYTKEETSSAIAQQITELGVPSTYWGQAPADGTVSGSITLSGGDTVNWGENNPSIVGNGQSSLMLRSGVLSSDTTGQYTQIAVGRSGLVLDHYANGVWERTAKISGVANGTSANDAINLSQISSTGWVDVENSGSSYNKAGAVVTVNISEAGTFTTGDWISLFTLPEGYRPSITIVGAATITTTSQTFSSAVINISNDGVVQVNITTDATNIYGSVTFLI